jgi:hypothetical protein
MVASLLLINSGDVENIKPKKMMELVNTTKPELLG